VAAGVKNCSSSETLNYGVGIVPRPMEDRDVRAFLDLATDRQQALVRLLCLSP
jgi:hypothetical protein